MVGQQFHTADVLRLEVEADPSGLVNLIQNSSGELGGWGWITPVDGSAMAGAAVKPAAGTRALRYRGNGTTGDAEWFTSEPIPVVAGRYVAASWVPAMLESTTYYRASFEWLDVSQALLSTSTPTAVLPRANGVVPVALGPLVVPASAAYVRLRFDLYSDSGGTTNPAANSVWFLNRVTVAQAATSGELAGLSFIPPIDWHDILGSAHEITVNREELNLGTCEGVILDAALDPAQAGTLRPGRGLRLTALTDDGWTPIFTGKLRRAQVTYDPLDTSSKRARISFLAVDNTAALANTRRPDGVETIAELPYVLEGAGVPWSVNGSGSQVPTATVVATNENASAADQVAITRDSNLGRAWVDRFNVLQVWDADLIDATVRATLDEESYSNVSIDYDTERCINYVTVRVVAHGPSGETEETTYGPYLDPDSVATWGVRSAEFTVQWVDVDEAALATFASAILSANATPVVRINSLTLPLRYPDDVADLATLDLYDLVTASNTNAGVTSDSRITKLAHTITGTSWTVALDFSTEGNVAAPQETPPLPSNRVSDWWPEVRMLHGAPSMCPADFLVMDGGTYDPTACPELAAHLTGLGLPTGVLPDYTDVFPIGAGTKAVGTNGGSPTKTIAAENLPIHDHGAGTLATGNPDDLGGRADGGTNTPSTVHKHPITGRTANASYSGTPTPLDVMPPWRAVYFIIRAH